jgi:sulfonate transport system substrate-binding protein
MKLLAVVLGVALAGLASAASADPLIIRHGYGQLTNALSPIVFQKTDLMQHYGKSYVVEPTHFQGSSAEVTAIASGQIDIITVGNSSLALAVENAGLEEFRVIADGFQDGVDDHFTSPFMVRNDSGIKTIEDLKGKVLVTNVLGGSLDIAMRVLLHQHHLENKRDYTALDAEFANMPPMLLDGKVDLVGLVAPWCYDARLLAQAHTLFTQKDAMGPSQVILLAARTPFLEKNRAAMIDFFEDLLRGIHWFTDPANRDAAIAIIAKATRQPPARLASYMFTERDIYRDPMARPNIDALQHDLDTQAAFGFLKSSLDVRKYVDLSYLDAATKRLK